MKIRYYLSALFFSSCIHNYEFKREFAVENINSMTCIKKSMRVVIPDIKIAEYGMPEDQFKARWHVLDDKSEAVVTVNSKQKPSIVTIEGTGQQDVVLYTPPFSVTSEAERNVPFITYTSKPEDSRLYQMENLIKADCNK
ncbi:hypothetical protein CIK05_03765 [Bdellovibrio sp. qaytius]|nr:hypothetical protein CIK05_03765 [Bdellovibrio sp. qaytius]